jgi:alkaline phosphatase
MRSVIFSLLIVVLISCSSNESYLKKGNVVFIHPDGTSLANWIGMRLLYYGPDSESNWEKLPDLAIYSPHTKNSLTPSSNAGATMHAYGRKVVYDSYGMDGTDSLKALSGEQMSIMQEAKKEGILTGIINSGHIVEPGTGVFVASSESRNKYEEITQKIIESGTDLIFSGGEEFLLPVGVKGKFCEGRREDGLNLINWAIENGYHILYSKDDLLKIPEETDKVLGVFAAKSTFNDKSEEELEKLGLKNFDENAPTLAEMTKAAINFFDKRSKQFFLVIEEEGTDNFGNHTNANGMFEALKRADDAIGVVSSYIDKNNNTLLITTADSEAGGMEVLGYSYLESDENIPQRDVTGSQLDGVSGTQSKPFLAMPDKYGNRFPFVVAWSTGFDVSGSVVSRAKGLNSQLVNGNIQNTDIYRIMYATLFGRLLEQQ